MLGCVEVGHAVKTHQSHLMILLSIALFFLGGSKGLRRFYVTEDTPGIKKRYPNVMSDEGASNALAFARHSLPRRAHHAHAPDAQHPHKYR